MGLQQVQGGPDAPVIDSRTRTYLLDEFQRDVNQGRLHVPSELTSVGTDDWPVLLQLTLMEGGPEALAQQLCHRGRMRDASRAVAVAEQVWRRLMQRAICRRAIDDGEPDVEVRSDSSSSATGRRIDPRRRLEQLRASTDLLAA